MKRLTEWSSSGHAAIIEHHENYIDKLAAYEDIGFTPPEIKTAIGIVELLAKTDYPHNFQHEAPWVVEFCKKITSIQEIAKLWRVETIRNHEEDNNGTTD